MKPLPYFAGHRLRRPAGILVAAGATAWLLLYRLGQLTPGLGPGETPLPATHALLRELIHNPLNLLLVLVRLLISLVPLHGSLAARLPSVVLAVIMLAAFGLLIRFWYGTRTAYMGVALLALSPWFLHTARQANDAVMYALTVTLLLLFNTLWQQRKTPLWWWLAPVLNGVLLYVPGGVWLIALGILWQRQSYKDSWQALSRPWRLGWLCIWVAVITPLISACFHAPRLLYAWAGLPSGHVKPAAVAHTWLITWQHVFIRGPQPVMAGLGYLALLSVFATVMVAIGGYFYAIHWRAARSRLLFAYILIGSVLVALGGPVTVGILLPLIFILAAGGIGYLLREWFVIFPRNPLAKIVGYTLIVLALALTGIYNLRQYFVAWPDAPTTQAAFRRSL